VLAEQQPAARLQDAPHLGDGALRLRDRAQRICDDHRVGHAAVERERFGALLDAAHVEFGGVGRLARIPRKPSGGLTANSVSTRLGS
jgi:hypothetical protein